MNLTGNIVLGPNQYGKAECRVVRMHRETPRHEIRDLNVSTCLRGDFDAAYTEGDQAAVLPTDSQKQTAYAYAKDLGGRSIEQYGLALAKHFVHDVAPVRAARVEIGEYTVLEPAHDRVMATSLIAQTNDNEVFHAADRPYGLIQATVLRDDAPDAGSAWAGFRTWTA